MPKGICYNASRQERRKCSLWHAKSPGVATSGAERKDNADVEVMSEHLWRVEIELKRDMVDYWNDCFNDLHILKPDWTSPEKLNEQAMVYMLSHEEGKWGELNKRTKYKYKKIIKEISPIDLTEIMKLTLRENEKQLQKQIDFWQREFRFWE